MNIPYRVRRALRHLVIGALVLTLFASVILFCWLLWLNRYVIYSRDGAKIDFSLSIQYAPGETPVPPDRPAHITIHDRVDENDPEQENKEMTNFSGYFVTLEELTSDFEGVSKKLTALPSGTAVMLQLPASSAITSRTDKAFFQNPERSFFCFAGFQGCSCQVFC